MQSPVRLELFKDGVLLEQFIAHSEEDLNCRIEVLTGIAWLDTLPLYQKLMESSRDRVTEIYHLCSSYEKWGDLQQEVAKIKVRMHRIKSANASDQ